MSRRTSQAIAVTAIAMIAVFGLSAGRANAQDKKPVPVEPVRNVDEPGFNPYQQSAEGVFNDCCGTVSFSLPANKVVVVEHVSLSGSTTSAGLVGASLRCSQTSDASGAVEHFLVLIPQGTVLGTTFYTASQPIKCYATAPGQLSLSVERNGFTPGPQHWFMGVSGYTVPR